MIQNKLLLKAFKEMRKVDFGSMCQKFDSQTKPEEIKKITREFARRASDAMIECAQKAGQMNKPTSEYFAFKMKEFLVGLLRIPLEEWAKHNPEGLSGPAKRN